MRNATEVDVNGFLMNTTGGARQTINQVKDGKWRIEPTVHHFHNNSELPTNDQVMKKLSPKVQQFLGANVINTDGINIKKVFPSKMKSTREYENNLQVYSKKQVFKHDL